MSADANPPSASELILYRTDDARTRVEVRLEGGTVWLTQAQMAELFQTTPQNITLHLKAIYADGELAEAATWKDYLQVRSEGARQVPLSHALRCNGGGSHVGDRPHARQEPALSRGFAESRA